MSSPDISSAVSLWYLVLTIIPWTLPNSLPKKCRCCKISRHQNCPSGCLRMLWIVMWCFMMVALQIFPSKRSNFNSRSFFFKQLFFRAQQGFESMKATFGENKCFLLQINSQKESMSDSPDPWLKYLKKYHKAVRTFNLSLMCLSLQHWIYILGLFNRKHFGQCSKNSPRHQHHSNA